MSLHVRVALDGHERTKMGLPLWHGCARGEPYPPMRGRALVLGPVTIEVLWSVKERAA